MTWSTGVSFGWNRKKKRRLTLRGRIDLRSKGSIAVETYSCNRLQLSKRNLETNSLLWIQNAIIISKRMLLYIWSLSLSHSLYNYNKTVKNDRLLRLAWKLPTTFLIYARVTYYITYSSKSSSEIVRISITLSLEWSPVGWPVDISIGTDNPKLKNI